MFTARLRVSAAFGPCRSPRMPRVSRLSVAISLLVRFIIESSPVLD